MARALGKACIFERQLKLQFAKGSPKRLRVGGWYSGYETKDELKVELIKAFRAQQQCPAVENLGHYLVTQSSEEVTSARSSSSPETSPPQETSSASASDLPPEASTAGAPKASKRKAARVVADPPITYSTRSAEKRMKLEAAEKYKLAASEKRRLLASEKKRKLARDHKLAQAGAMGLRKIVTRSGLMRSGRS